MSLGYRLGLLLFRGRPADAKISRRDVDIDVKSLRLAAGALEADRPYKNWTMAIAMFHASQ